MTAKPLHLLHFEGGPALSSFRAQALLKRLQMHCARVSAVQARFVHWVAFDEPPPLEATSDYVRPIDEPMRPSEAVRH